MNVGVSVGVGAGVSVGVGVGVGVGAGAGAGMCVGGAGTYCSTAAPVCTMVNPKICNK